MVSCEQFIFTAAKIDDNEGYQVIAKSQGVSDDVVQDLREYLFPLGINDEEFQSSKSFIELSKNQFAYSIIKNVGVGYDGRRGTLYNHTFLIEKNDFEQLHNDSRIFDKYFIEDSTIRGELKTIQIKPEEISPNFKILNTLNPLVLKSTLFRLFKKKKIALVNIDEVELIQNLLALLPPNQRIISFSTLVNDPLRQHRYKIMQIPENAKNKLSGNIAVIHTEIPKLAIKLTGDLGNFVKILVEIIIKEDRLEWTKILNDYEKLSTQLGIVKQIKSSEIFNVSEYAELVTAENYLQLKNKVEILYSSKKFQDASPKVIVSITKKIRNIVKKAFKKQIKETSKKQSSKIDQLVFTTTILLDCINYLNDYTEKEKSLTIQILIEFEKIKLVTMLDEYSPQ